jgi:ActR/RegA family two-component response regulator
MRYPSCVGSLSEPSRRAYDPKSLTVAIESPTRMHRTTTRVLFVDDEIDDREGFHVDCVQCGADGLTQMRTAAYDAVVLDMHLPEVMGLTI